VPAGGAAGHVRISASSSANRIPQSIFTPIYAESGEQCVIERQTIAQPNLFPMQIKQSIVGL
jgi:hypothetical protein